MCKLIRPLVVFTVYMLEVKSHALVVLYECNFHQNGGIGPLLTFEVGTCVGIAHVVSVKWESHIDECAVGRDVLEEQQCGIQFDGCYALLRCVFGVCPWMVLPGDRHAEPVHFVFGRAVQCGVPSSDCGVGVISPSVSSCLDVSECNWWHG